MFSKRILVTGADGQLGREFQRLSATTHHEFTFANRRLLNIADSKKVRTFFSNEKIDVCINAAAYTKVDYAENDSTSSRVANVEGVVNLAEACEQHDVKMIHVSTDFVFDGERHTAYKEGDYANPLNIYGKTKLEGEQALLDILEDAIVVRTSWLYSSFGSNFVNTMLQLGKKKDNIKVVSDQIGTPTYAKDLAHAILSIISSKWVGGTYHYSNEGVGSWYDLAHSIFEIAEMHKVSVLPIKSKEFPTIAKRPLFSVLDKSRIKKVYDLEIRHWRDALKEMLTT